MWKSCHSSSPAGIRPRATCQAFGAGTLQPSPCGPSRRDLDDTCLPVSISLDTCNVWNWSVEQTGVHVSCSANSSIWLDNRFFDSLGASMSHKSSARATFSNECRDRDHDPPGAFDVSSRRVWIQSNRVWMLWSQVQTGFHINELRLSGNKVQMTH